MVQRKQKQSSLDVKQKKTSTKPVLISFRVKKPSSKTPAVSTSGVKRKTNGFPQWTEARRHSFIVSVLRTGTRRWPPKYETLNEAKTEKRINPKTGRLAQHFKCAGCAQEFPAKEVAVDHTKAVVGPEGFTTWDNFVTNLFCDKENLQVLCTACHKVKTLQEKGERDTNRSKRKT